MQLSWNLTYLIKSQRCFLITICQFIIENDNVSADVRFELTSVMRKVM